MKLWQRACLFFTIFPLGKYTCYRFRHEKESKLWNMFTEKENSAEHQLKIACYFLSMCFACSHIRQDTFYMCYQKPQSLPPGCKVEWDLILCDAFCHFGFGYIALNVMHNYPSLCITFSPSCSKYIKLHKAVHKSVFYFLLHIKAFLRHLLLSQ